MKYPIYQKYLSGKSTLQIELPDSSKLTAQKLGYQLDVIFISTKPANSTLNGVGYHVCQWV
jgi:hypothetical protein